MLTQACTAPLDTHTHTHCYRHNTQEHSQKTDAAAELCAYIWSTRSHGQPFCFCSLFMFAVRFILCRFKCGDKTLDHHYSFMYPHHNSSVPQTLSFLFICIGLQCVNVWCEEWDKGRASLNILTSHNVFAYFFNRAREILNLAVNPLCTRETQ